MKNKYNTINNRIAMEFDALSDKATKWVGSTVSIIVHTLFFIGIFVLYFLGIAIDAILLILTTIVSLEAIYLAIFIQRSVNKQSAQLDEVEEHIEEVEETIEEDEREEDIVEEKMLRQLEAILKEIKKKK